MPDWRASAPGPMMGGQYTLGAKIGDTNSISYISEVTKLVNCHFSDQGSKLYFSNSFPPKTNFVFKLQENPRNL